MKRLGQLMVGAILVIIFIPAAITILLGNNHQLGGDGPISIDEQESIDKEALSQRQILGIVAREIPIEYEKEAIKAQVIMARSYIGSKKDQDFHYMKIEEMKNVWGNDYNKNLGKLKEAVEETKNVFIRYDDQVVQPLYHRQSAGITQDPLEIWGLEIPYLESVDSSWDQMDPDLIREKEYSAKDLIDLINEGQSDQVLLAYNLEAQIQIIERSQGGYVKSIQVGHRLMGGEEFRKLLGLSSSCFSISYNKDQIIIRTKGIGHGVGLSQYGANAMAKEGKTYEEILKHYFPKAQIYHEK